MKIKSICFSIIALSISAQISCMDGRYYELMDQKRKTDCSDFFGNFDSNLASFCAKNGTFPCEALRSVCLNSDAAKHPRAVNNLVQAIAFQSKNTNLEDQRALVAECLPKKKD